MREYKFVHLNKGLRLSRSEDLQIAEKTLNEYIREGWQLQQLLSPSDVAGVIVGVLYKEVE